MPSKRVLAKLIKRATQITDTMTELNNKEYKTDPRTVK